MRTNASQRTIRDAEARARRSREHRTRAIRSTADRKTQLIVEGYGPQGEIVGDLGDVSEAAEPDLSAVMLDTPPPNLSESNLTHNDRIPALHMACADWSKWCIRAFASRRSGTKKRAAVEPEAEKCSVPAEFHNFWFTAEAIAQLAGLADTSAILSSNDPENEFYMARERNNDMRAAFETPSCYFFRPFSSIEANRRGIFEWYTPVHLSDVSGAFLTIRKLWGDILEGTERRERGRALYGMDSSLRPLFTPARTFSSRGSVLKLAAALGKKVSNFDGFVVFLEFLIKSGYYRDAPTPLGFDADEYRKHAVDVHHRRVCLFDGEDDDDDVSDCESLEDGLPTRTMYARDGRLVIEIQPAAGSASMQR